jgi:hypothetical protein
VTVQQSAPSPQKAQVAPSASEVDATQTEQQRVNLDVAWRAHVAQENWATKVDTKASIFLALDGVVIGVTLAARAQKGSFIDVLGGWRAGLLVAALVTCFVAALIAAVAISPVLGRPRNRGTIYFGDLRRRHADDLAAQLATMTVQNQISQVSEQLVAMARITWLKHRLMQVAVAAALVGYVLIMLVLLV